MFQSSNSHRGLPMSEKGKNMAERVRTITWNDPKANARDAMSISGLDFLRGVKAGEIPPPPVAKLLGYRVAEVDHGLAVFELEPDEYLCNPFGTVHGGIASTLLDTAMTASILSTLPKGLACSTLEIKVNFISPITIDTGLLRCEAKSVHVGKRVATAEGKIMDQEEKLYAVGMNTCMVFPVK